MLSIGMLIWDVHSHGMTTHQCNTHKKRDLTVCTYGKSKRCAITYVVFVCTYYMYICWMLILDVHIVCMNLVCSFDMHIWYVHTVCAYAGKNKKSGKQHIYVSIYVEWQKTHMQRKETKTKEWNAKSATTINTKAKIIYPLASKKAKN